MARITLFRHAKAENPRTDLADIDRSLAPRGGAMLAKWVVLSLRTGFCLIW